MAGKDSDTQVCESDPALGCSVGSVGSPPWQMDRGTARGMAEAGQPRGGHIGGRRQREQQQFAGAEGRREACGQEGTCSS